jgi:hypothetical protein
MPQSPTYPDASTPQEQQPTEVPDPTPLDPQQATAAPDVAVSPVDQPTADLADPSTPDTTVAEATSIPVVKAAPTVSREARAVAFGPGEQLDPSWDPRGRTIAYMTTKPGATARPYDIAAVNPDGTGQ